MSEFENPVFCALDTRDLDLAVGLAHDLRGLVGGIKVGMEFFYAHGKEGYNKIAAAGLPIFLDLKLHDIPNTVAGAIGAILPLKPAIVTVHAGGGKAMMAAARSAADTCAGAKPLLVAVTVLTSLDGADLAGMNVLKSMQEHANKLASLALDAGLDGAVCSPREIEQLRASCGEKFKLVVPGIRPEGADLQDQKRTLTPREARALGADILVIGRPITGSSDPAAAARTIRDTLG